MPITPTSTKSKQYQALGIDEIANDIETAFTAINALGGYTETIVNIPSAQILSMGSSPVQLLPAAGAGNYYDIDKVILEFTGTAYTSTSTQLYITQTNDWAYFSSNIITIGTEPQIVYPSNYIYDADASDHYESLIGINGNVQLWTYNGDDPAGGTGTLRVKIYHKTITFGA